MQPSSLAVFHWRPRPEAYAEGWHVEADHGDRFDGAWVVSGRGGAVVWAVILEDANSVSECPNAIRRLEPDVRRYGGAPDPMFPVDLARGGLFELVSKLAWSIIPGERWESAPPIELKGRGKRLLDDLKSFAEATSLHRFGGSTWWSGIADPNGPVMSGDGGI